MTLKEIRLSKGLTLKQASSDMGIHLSTLCKYEKGYSKLDEKTIEMLKNYYGVNDFDEIHNRYCSLENEIKELNEIIKKLNCELTNSRLREQKLEQENRKLIKKLNKISSSVKKNIDKIFSEGE